MKLKLTDKEIAERSLKVTKLGAFISEKLYSEANIISVDLIVKDIFSVNVAMVGQLLEHLDDPEAVLKDIVECMSINNKVFIDRMSKMSFD